MKFIIERNEFKNRMEYHLLIDYDEVQTAGLDRHDRALLDECDRSDKISDKLLGLETIARKIERGKSNDQKIIEGRKEETEGRPPGEGEGPANAEGPVNNRPERPGPKS